MSRVLAGYFLGWAIGRASEKKRKPVTKDDPSYTVALEEARRAFDALADEVTVIRGRAVSLLGIGGLAASFIGGLATRNGAPVTGWTWVTVSAFAATALLCIWLLWPRRFHIAQDPSSLVTWVEDLRYSRQTAERELALWLGMQYEENRSAVDRMGGTLFLASITLLTEIAALVLDLLTR